MDPALFLLGIVEAARRGPLEDWRDGRTRIVLTRRMLAHLLQLLKGAGLSAIPLRRWSLWLTDRERVEFLPDGPPGLPWREEYLDAARRGGAIAILTPHPRDFEDLETGGIPVRAP
jgi:hypothetical protein